MLRDINNTILKTAPRHIVKASAPNTFGELMNSRGDLVIWSGESENTIFGDAAVNWAFRALHDRLHLETRLDFSPSQEIELGRIQAARYSGLLADLMYIEVAGQAEYFLRNGIFVADQKQFTLDALRKKGYKHGI